MFKQALRSSLIILVSLTLVSCGGGGSTGFNSENTDSSLNNNTGNNGGNSGAAAVVPVPSGNKSIFLSWTPPTQNTDNSVLTDLTGYKIYYGISSNALTASFTVADSSASSATVPLLASSTLYYFSVKVLNSKNVESDFSNIISKTTTG